MFFGTSLLYIILIPWRNSMERIRNISISIKQEFIILVGRIIKFLISVWERFLDLSTPIYAWFIVHFFRSSWLSVESKKITKSLKSVKQRSVISFSDRWAEWMLPQNWGISLLLSLGVVFLPQILIIFITLFGIRVPSLNLGVDGNLIANAWQILASILGISFVIIVFLTQYAHDRDYERRAFPLFASSTMMILTVLIGMLTILSFGTNLSLLQKYSIQSFIQYINAWNLFLFVLNIILVIRLYIKTYLFLQPRYFQNAVQKYGLLRIRRSVYDELIIRIETNLLYKYCSENKIDLSYIEDHKEKIAVKLKINSGVREIVDIHLMLMDIAVKRAEKYSKQEGTGITFIGHLQKKISIENPEIAFIANELNHVQITGILERSFKLAEVQIPRRKQDITDDVLLNRDLLSDAIQSRRSAVVESLLDQYVVAIKTFLEVANEMGIYFSPEIASQEDQSFRRWQFIDEIRNQYISLLDTAIKSGNIEIVQHFVGFLFGVMWQALEKRDHLIFRSFARLFPTIYHRVWNNSDDNFQKDQVFDHCGRLIFEIQNLKIDSLLENPNIPNSELPSIAHYSRTLLITLNDLLKQTIDVKDFKFFGKYYGIVRIIPKTDLLNNLSSEIELIQYQIKVPQDQANQSRITADLDRKRILYSLLKDNQELRKGMFMGIGGWLVHSLENKIITKESYSTFISIFSREFSSLEELSDAYDQAFRSDAHDIFPWNSWEMNEWPDSYEGNTGTLIFSQWIERFYSLQALSLLPPNLENLPTLSPTPSAKGKLDNLKTQLSFIRTNEVWLELIHPSPQQSFDQKAEALIQIHQIAVDKQNEIEEIELSKQDVDNELVEKFRNDLIKTWKESASLRALFKSFDRYKECPDVEITDELQDKVFGVNELAEKGAFVMQERVYFSDWGGSYGRGLATAEDHLIITELNSLPEIKIELAQFDRTLEDTVMKMKEDKLSLVILYSDWVIHKQLNENHDFEPSWRSKRPAPKIFSYEGYFKECPVFRISGIAPKSLILLDFSRFGLLVQYKPFPTSESFPLYISVNLLSEDDIEKIYADSPKWLKDIGKGEKPEKEIAKRKIQQYVGLKIFERFRIEEKNNKSGVQILINPN
jgi:hypothetical protein